ncbi:MAG: hypothetical protein JSS66_15795 [Armatimonadetes bacterium]|nr:hypothetical protein [Armatimonadota bacterium]
MNKLRIVPLLLFPVLAAAASIARADDDATRILSKVRQLDLLNQMLPVLMTPEQIQHILPALEKARAADAANQKSELEQMKKIEAKVDAAIKEAKDKKLVPSRDLVEEVIKMVGGFQKQRANMILQQSEPVVRVVMATLDAGQVKAAANAIPVRDDPDNKLTEEMKLGRWVRAVLMDPLAYDLLVEMSKGKSSH